MTTNAKNQPIDIKQLPSSMTLCFVDRCPRKADCLRYQAQADGHSKGSNVISCIHPEIELSAEGCTQYVSTQKHAYVRGFKRLFDQMPYSMVGEIKLYLRSHYGKTKFYRMMAGEIYLSPADQKELLGLIAQHGIQLEQPEFDHTEWRYDLSKTYVTPSTAKS